MNKQEAIEKIEDNLMYEITRHIGKAVNIYDVTDIVKQIDEPEKPVVPQFVADFISSEQRSCSALSEAIDNMDMRDEGEVTSWFYDNSETFAKAWLYGYEVEKEKLYRAKNRHTGEYLCYCFKFYHDKNSSSENQRFTAEEKRWKELGYWGNDLYAFEEAEGEDE
ncbi:DUF1642 domain-containing protein [Streptococcus alactolyticus]|uniref:DUF1642 domain-containing protein n=1 Tax=Streptococcus alactolyticus TaxID=29389 RepID=UPI00195E98CA|nr:DUF1642 domain-containing protein [Streptococcus alactolyticus]MBM6697531.1 DUF1642 domain-containing protein [Streptococcus alactolyticus]